MPGPPFCDEAETGRHAQGRSSSRQCVEPAVAGWGDEEVSASDGEGVFGHGFVLQPVLDGLEAFLQVALEAGEDQALVVGAALVVVAAPDQGRGMASVGCCPADVGVKWCDLAIGV